MKIVANLVCFAWMGATSVHANWSLRGGVDGNEQVPGVNANLAKALGGEKYDETVDGTRKNTKFCWQERQKGKKCEGCSTRWRFCRDCCNKSSGDIDETSSGSFDSVDRDGEWKSTETKESGDSGLSGDEDAMVAKALGGEKFDEIVDGTRRNTKFCWQERQKGWKCEGCDTRWRFCRECCNKSSGDIDETSSGSFDSVDRDGDWKSAETEESGDSGSSGDEDAVVASM